MWQHQSSNPQWVCSWLNSIKALIFLAGTCGQETWTRPARLEHVKTMKSFKYAAGSTHILTGPVCKMIPLLWHLNPWFLSLSIYSLIGRMLQPKEWPSHEHARSDFSLWCLTWQVSTSNMTTNASADCVILILYFFPFYVNTHGSYLLTVTLPRLKCTASYIHTVDVCDQQLGFILCKKTMQMCVETFANELKTAPWRI